MIRRFASIRYRTLARLLRDESGVQAVEFALALSPLLLLVMGAIEMGRVLFLQSALHYSVEEAARCASNSTCATSTQIASFASGRSGVGIPSSAFTASTASCGNLVTASYPVKLFIPFANLTVTLTARSCFPT